MPHALGDMREVVGRAAEDGDSVQIFASAKHLFQRVVGGVAAISLAEPLAAICAQISHCGDRAVRMLVPVELGSESSTDHVDAALLAAPRLRSQSSRHVGRGGQRGGIGQPLPWEFPS